MAQYLECARSLSVLESESLEGHEADASLTSQSKPHLDLGSWQTNLLFAGLKSLALQSSAEAEKMSAALARPLRPQTWSNPTQGGSGAGSEGATHGLWSLGLEGGSRAGCVSGRQEGRGSHMQMVTTGQMGTLGGQQNTSGEFSSGRWPCTLDP